MAGSIHTNTHYGTYDDDYGLWKVLKQKEKGGVGSLLGEIKHQDLDRV